MKTFVIKITDEVTEHLHGILDLKWFGRSIRYLCCFIIQLRYVVRLNVPHANNIWQGIYMCNVFPIVKSQFTQHVKRKTSPKRQSEVVVNSFMHGWD